ncbi:MAG: phosphatidate cytidylyltransferase [Proteobacteria bacterium]|nr:phosphatidate cytidylyltransferase [Pseudomonadota bacterium]
MLPIVLGAIWLGGWFFVGLTALAAGMMYWEWQGLCGKKDDVAKGLAMLCALGILLSGWAGPGVAIVAGVSVALLVALPSRGHRLFLSAGFIYILLACLGLVWLRSLDPAGVETVIWLGVVVVMTDTCAYFTGRTLGGPKLAPKISPKKTWSGLVGGIAGAAVAGGILASVIDASIVTVVLVSGVLAVVAQIGDLAVSKAKRAFGVKDSGNIIPGHGGALDRFDGVLSASIAIALLSLAGGGSPLLWL